MDIASMAISLVPQAPCWTQSSKCGIKIM